MAKHTDFSVNAFHVYVLDHCLRHVVELNDVDVDDELMMEDSKNLMMMMEMVNRYSTMKVIYNSMLNRLNLRFEKIIKRRKCS